MVRKKGDKSFPEIIREKAARKKQPRSNKNLFWSGFSVFGIIGWSIVLPSLLGAALGLWLDENHPRQQPWVLALLLAGLSLGCFNAWRILERHRAQIKATEDDEGNE